VGELFGGKKSKMDSFPSEVNSPTLFAYLFLKKVQKRIGKKVYKNKIGYFFCHLLMAKASGKTRQHDFTQNKSKLVH
jgi:hypothetical protein